MFIKIGTMLINLDNVTRVQKVEGQRVEFEMNVAEDGEPFNFAFIYTGADYPQALAAYEYLCNGAKRFDDSDGIPAADDTGDVLTIRKSTRGEGYDVVDEQNEMVYLRNASHEKATAFIRSMHPAAQPADTATGYEMRPSPKGDIYGGIWYGNRRIHENDLLLHHSDWRKVGVILNTETATLRSENARLQAAIKDAKEELRAMNAYKTKAYEILDSIE